MDIVMVGIGVALLAGANIILGGVIAGIEHRFDKLKFWKGVYKASLIVTSLCMVALAGYLNPNIMAVEIGEVEMNLLVATNTVLVIGFITYGGMVINKLLEALQLKK